MRLTYFIILIAGMLLGGCNDSSSPTTEEPASATPTQQPATVDAPVYPSFPVKKVENLFQHCDYIDYIFYDLPISMSIKEKPAIQYNITHIGSQPARQLPNCKPVGRLFYQVKGENVEQAELYFSQGCTYFVFLENDQPKYGNMMTDKGIEYLNGMLGQAGFKGVNQ
jgi:hypothetical protein